MAGSSHDPLQSFAVASGAVSKPGGDAAGQDALHSAGVEGSEDAGAHSKLPQPSQEEEALMCLLQHCVCVSRGAMKSFKGGMQDRNLGPLLPDDFFFF